MSKHRHIHYGLDRAKTMADLKAISLNVMHTSIKMTDQTYSRLSEDEVHVRIKKLRKTGEDERGSLEADFKLFEQFLEWRKGRK